MALKLIDAVIAPITLPGEDSPTYFIDVLYQDTRTDQWVKINREIRLTNKEACDTASTILNDVGTLHGYCKYCHEFLREGTNGLWHDDGKDTFTQYCWVDPEHGSQVHEPKD